MRFGGLCGVASALALASTLWAQAPKWSAAELAEVAGELGKVGAPPDLTGRLAARAKEAPDSQLVVVGHHAVRSGKAEGVVHFAACIVRIDGESESAVWRRAAELATKGQVAEDAWRTWVDALAFPSLAVMPEQPECRFQPGAAKPESWESPGFVAAYLKIPRKDVKPDAEQFAAFTTAYLHQVELLVLRAESVGDAELLRRALDDHASLRALPARLQPYRLSLSLMEGSAPAQVAQAARQLGQHWLATDITEVRPWIELGVVCERVGDLPGVKMAIAQARTAALAELRQKSQGLVIPSRSATTDTGASSK